MHFLYTIAIYVYYVLIRIASPFNSKAKQWVVGREGIFLKVESAISTSSYSGSNSHFIWFHCASLGEFEQGRPLMEKLKIQDPNCKIVLTFFSPSGYEVRKNYNGADHVFYLPIDSPKNAKRFVKLIQPKAVFFIKYEFWFNYLIELKKHKIPTYLVSGIFRVDHYFFKFYGSWFRKQLSCFSHFYLQTEESLQLLKKVGFTNTTLSGDTRFDRVFEISQTVKSIPIIEKFKQEKNIFIAGSTWSEDEKIIANCRLQITDYKLIIAPHEIDEVHLKSLEGLLGNIKKIRYSQATEQNIINADVLIIDNIGMLSSLYQYGSIAYVGGGFGKGIHNIIEAATFGMPVIFGPNYHNFSEAKELIQLGGAFSISSSKEFEKVFTSFSNSQVLKSASNISKNYVTANTGATSKVLNSISY